jgi:CubicO group peptidase (beta-lactamase class C family)
METIDQPGTERRVRVENAIPWRQAAQFETPETRPLAQIMEHFDVPGISVAVIHDSCIEWAKGYGVKEAGKPEPVTTETLFQAGSISKPVAATAVMRLVEAETLDLDEDVNRYLTSWKVPSRNGWQPRVTLRQLLSHTAGLTVHGFPGYSSWRDVPTVVQVLDGEPPANTAPVRVNTIPGTQYRYSGGGTTIAQLVMMDVLRKPFPKILHELVFEPLGMMHSTYEQPLPAARAAAAATAHSPGSYPLAGKCHVYPEMAAAGLWTTASDLARFAIAIQSALAGKPDAILSAETVGQMLTPQVENHIGLGFFLEGKSETARFGHGGVDEGFVAELKVYARHGQGIAILCNSANGWSVMPSLERAVAAVYDWPDFLPTPPVVAPQEPTDLVRFAGKYELRLGFDFLFSVEGGSLLVTPTGQPPLTLLATSDAAFFCRTLDCEFRFTVAETGAVESLIFHQNGREMVAKPTS